MNDQTHCISFKQLLAAHPVQQTKLSSLEPCRKVSFNYLPEGVVSVDFCGYWDVITC